MQTIRPSTGPVGMRVSFLSLGEKADVDGVTAS